MVTRVQLTVVILLCALFLGVRVEAPHASETSLAGVVYHAAEGEISVLDVGESDSGFVFDGAKRLFQVFLFAVEILLTFSFVIVPSVRRRVCAGRSNHYLPALQWAIAAGRVGQAPPRAV